MKQLQQGDVLLKRIERIPEGAKKKKKDKRGYVLAEGEATGHHHRIAEGVELYAIDHLLFLEVKEEATLVHEEHKAVKVPPGCYQVGRVKEYDYFQEMERTVID